MSALNPPLKQGQVQYLYRHAIGGFFEFPTENARKLIPPFMSPVEPHHGQSCEHQARDEQATLHDDFPLWSAVQWKDIAADAQTERRSGAGPVRNLLDG